MTYTLRVSVYEDERRKYTTTLSGLVVDIGEAYGRISHMKELTAVEFVRILNNAENWDDLGIDGIPVDEMFDWRKGYEEYLTYLAKQSVEYQMRMERSLSELREDRDSWQRLYTLANAKLQSTREFVLNRRNDIQNGWEDFGMLRPLLEYFADVGKVE